MAKIIASEGTWCVQISEYKNLNYFPSAYDKIKQDNVLTLDNIIMQIKLHTAPDILAICRALFAVKGFLASGR